MRATHMGWALFLVAGLAAADPVELDGVTVVGETEPLVVRQEAPISVIVIGPEELEQFNDYTVGEVLTRQPGIFFGGPPGEAKDLRMRGLDKEYTQVLINGEPIPCAGEKREFQLDRIPANMVERIEIIRTPSAAYSGQGIAGTINIILKRTPATRVANFRLFGGTIEGREAPGLSLALGNQHGNVGYLLNGAAFTRRVFKDKVKTGTKADGSPDKGEREEEWKSYTDRNFAPRLSWQIANQQSLEIAPLYLKSTEEKTKAKFKFTADGSNDGTEDETEVKDRLGRGMTATWKGALIGGHLTAQFGRNETQEKKEKHAQTFRANGSPDKTILEIDEKRDRDLRGKITGEWLLGSAHLQKSSVEWVDKERDKNKSVIENGNPKTEAKDRYHLEERQFNIFVQDEWELGRGVLTFGVRTEHVDAETVSGAGLAAQATHRAWLPSAHFLHRLTALTNLRASAGRTTRRPKFDDMVPWVQSKAGSLNDPDQLGNPDLKPEMAWAYELGAERFFANRLGVLGVNVFYRDITDLMENRVEQNATSGRYESRPENVGNGSTQGVELDGRLRLAGIGLPNLTLFGNYAWLDSNVRDQATGEKRRFKEQPEYILNTGLEYAVTRTLSFGANFQRVGGSTSSEVKKDGKREVLAEAAREYLDAYIAHRITPNLRLRLSGNNLLEATKDKAKTIYKVDGSLDRFERDLEGSARLFLLSLAGSF